jgi:CheY-like chemotaxis protein
MRAGTEQKCFDSGMNDIVAKPMKLQMLQRILKKNDVRKLIRNDVSPISESYQSCNPINRMNIK